MKTSAKVIIGFVIVLVLGFGLYLAMRDTGTEEQTTSTSSAIITYTDDGFSPSTLTVTAGDTITVTNDSAEEIEFKSDPHPTHANNSELNQEDLPAGESQTFTVTTTGTWGYHNHYAPEKKGTVIVE